MSKFVIDLIDEFKSLDIVEDDFKLFVMSIEFDEFGEVTADATIEAVTHISVDSQHEECLLHTSPDSVLNNGKNDKGINVGKAVEELEMIEPGYFLCSKVKESANDTKENSNIGTDSPIIGFGENIELKQFFVVCEA